MKRNKFKDYVWFVAVMVFLIFLLEGMQFYADREHWLLRLTLNIQNAVKAYALNSEIKPDNAFAFFNASDRSLYKRIITYLYCVGIILAPFCTASAVTMLVRRPASYVFGLIHKKKKSDVLVVGEGRYRESFVNALSRDCRVILAEPDRVTDEKALFYMRRGISVLRCYRDLPEKLLLKRLRPLSRRNILLCADDAFENISMLRLILDCRRAAGSAMKLQNVFITGGNVVSDEMMRKMFDDEQNPGFEMKLIDADRMAADKVLARHPMYEGRTKDDADVHLGIIGFGGFGQSFLMEALGSAVLSADSTIRVDIFDKAISANIGRFLKRFSTEVLSDGVFSQEKGELPHYLLRIPGTQGRAFGTDGVVELHFWNVDTGTLAFNRAFEKSTADFPFTYMVIAVPDGETVSNAVTEMSRMLPGTVPQVVRVRSKKRGGYSDDNVHIIETDREIFSYDALTENDVVETAMEFNCRYEQLSGMMYEMMGKGGDPARMEIPFAPLTREEITGAWEKKIVFDRESSMALSRHQSVKAWLLSQGYDPEKDQETLQKIEHRRWNLFMIANGYSYAPGKKDVLKKRHPCISTWENLKAERPDVLAYDFIPYLMLKQK